MLKIGIIGTGYWGKHYVRILNNYNNVKLEVICDKIQENLNKIKIIYPNLSVTTELSNIFNYNLDAVVVVTPASTHYNIVKLCLNNNLHVLVEKPLTVDIDEAQELYKLSEEKNKKLMVGHTYLFNSCVEKIKEIINDNSFGKIHSISMERTNFGPIRKDVNVIWDLATHDISIILYLLGDIDFSKIEVIGNTILNNIDNAYIILKTQNNIIININVSWISAGKVRRTVINGEYKKIIFDEMDKNMPLQIYNSGLIKNINKQQDFTIGSIFMDGDILVPYIDYKEPLMYEVDTWLDAIKNNTLLKSDGEFGYRVVNILNKICLKLN